MPDWLWTGSLLVIMAILSYLIYRDWQVERRMERVQRLMDAWAECGQVPAEEREDVSRDAFEREDEASLQQLLYRLLYGKGEEK